MPDNPISTNTEDLAVTKYDAQSGAGAVDEKTPPPKTCLPTDVPEVGLAQRGEGEDAVVKRPIDV